MTFVDNKDEDDDDDIIGKNNNRMTGKIKVRFSEMTFNLLFKSRIRHQKLTVEHHAITSSFIANCHGV